MLIRVWGCRGSLATPGFETARYGGNTTCVEVRLDDGTLAILDAGSGIHRLGRKLLKDGTPQELFLLLTHSHWDHVLGFPFFAPAYLEKYCIHVRGGPDARTSLKKYLEHQMDPPYFPVEFKVLKASFDFNAATHEVQTIGAASVLPIPLSHPNGGYGYKFSENGRSFVFLTDNEPDYPHPGGLAREEYLKLCRKADLLFHDAQYTDQEYGWTRGWGHSTYSAALGLALEAGVKRFGVFHHDPDHTDEDLDRSIAACREEVSKQSAQLDCFGAQEGMEIRL